MTDWVQQILARRVEEARKGLGRGNWGHAGRPGQVGGSTSTGIEQLDSDSVDYLLSGTDEAERSIWADKDGGLHRSVGRTGEIEVPDEATSDWHTHRSGGAADSQGYPELSTDDLYSALVSSNRHDRPYTTTAVLNDGKWTSVTVAVSSSHPDSKRYLSWARARLAGPSSGMVPTTGRHIDPKFLNEGIKLGFIRPIVKGKFK